jgi:hypothetical protein
VIDSIVFGDNQSVRDFFAERRPAREIARLTGEGIRREGSRCLEGRFERGDGQVLCAQVVECETIETLLRLSAVSYTRNTFLYRRVNKFLRLGTESDAETSRNLGLYIGLLRECFCVRGELNPCSWDDLHVVYRGANFTLDVLADYARHPDEVIRWQGFASSSRTVGGALAGNVLFEISLTHPVASLAELSEFKDELEVVVSPYQRFSLRCVRWDCDSRRWILSVEEELEATEVQSWLAGYRVSAEPRVESK